MLAFELSRNDLSNCESNLLTSMSPPECMNSFIWGSRVVITFSVTVLVFSTTLDKKLPPLTQLKTPGDGGEPAVATFT